MALPECDPCSCIEPNIPNDKFKRDVEILLCAILGAVSGGELFGAVSGGNESDAFTFQTPILVPFGAIVSSYIATGFFAAANQFNFLKVTNTTDADVDVRIGLGGGAFSILANGVQEFNGNIFNAEELYLKYSSVAPTLGAIKFEGASR